MTELAHFFEQALFFGRFVKIFLLLDAVVDFHNVIGNFECQSINDLFISEYGTLAILFFVVF